MKPIKNYFTCNVYDSFKSHKLPDYTRATEAQTMDIDPNQSQKIKYVEIILVRLKWEWLKLTNTLAYTW